MKNPVLFFTYILIIGLGFTACNGIKFSHNLTSRLNDDQKLELALLQIARRRFTVPVQDYYEEVYFNTVYSGRYNDIGDRSSLFVEASPFNSGSAANANVIQKQLLEVVNQVFNDLRKYYALYSFYGGDKRFLQAYDEMLAFIQRADALVAPAVFVQAITDSLGFIHDQHFIIASQDEQYYSQSKRRRPNVLVWLEKLFLYPLLDGGWFAEIGEDQYIIDQQKNQELFKHIYPVLGDDGSIFWQVFFFLSAEEAEQPQVFQLLLNKVRNNSVVLANLVPVVWPVSLNTSAEGSDFTFKEYKDTNDVYWLRADHFKIGDDIWNFEEQKNTHAEAEEVLRFRRTALNFKSAQVAVLDLSRNTGGTNSIPYGWLRYYAYKRPHKILNENDDAFMPVYFANHNPSVVDNINIALPVVMLDTDYPLALVLQSKNTGSAGESFLFQLREHSNALFIGEPSFGALLAGNPLDRNYLYLYANLQITIPGLGLFYKKGFEECGFLPDFFVGLDNAEITLNNFLRRYQVDFVKEELRKAILLVQKECFNFLGERND